MPKKLAVGSENNRGLNAKSALFGTEPFVAKPSGLKILNLSQRANSDLIGGIDAASEDRWQSAASQQVKPIFLSVYSKALLFLLLDY